MLGKGTAPDTHTWNKTSNTVSYPDGLSEDRMEGKCDTVWLIDVTTQLVKMFQQNMEIPALLGTPIW